VHVEIKMLPMKGEVYETKFGADLTNYLVQSYLIPDSGSNSTNKWIFKQGIYCVFFIKKYTTR